MRRLYTYLSIALLTAATLSITVWTRMGGETVVRFGVELNDHSAAFWIALDKNWFEEEGVKIEYKTFSTGLELAAALLHGDIDVAIACIGPLIVAYDRGVEVRLAMMMHNHGYAVAVDPGSVETIWDLNGSTISSSGPGSPTWLLLRLVMDKYNLSINIVRNPPFISTSLLLTHKISAASLPEHYATLVSRMGAKILIRSQDVWPDMPGSGLAFAKSFLERHRDLAEKIVDVMIRAINYIRGNMYEASKIVAKHLASDVDTMYESMENLDYRVEINESSIREYVDYLLRYGVIRHNVSLSEFIVYMGGSTR